MRIPFEIVLIVLILLVVLILLLELHPAGRAYLIIHIQLAEISPPRIYVQTLSRNSVMKNMLCRNPR